MASVRGAEKRSRYWLKSRSRPRAIDRGCKVHQCESASCSLAICSCTVSLLHMSDVPHCIAPLRKKAGRQRMAVPFAKHGVLSRASNRSGSTAAMSGCAFLSSASRAEWSRSGALNSLASTRLRLPRTCESLDDAERPVSEALMSAPSTMPAVTLPMVRDAIEAIATNKLWCELNFTACSPLSRNLL